MLSVQQAQSFLETFEALLAAAKAGLEIWYRPHPLLHEYYAANYPESYSSTLETINQTFRNMLGVSEIELICSAELLVHNSGSFIAEWALTAKPSIFIENESYIYSNLNPWGGALLKGSILASSQELFKTIEMKDNQSDQNLEDREQVRTLLKTTFINQPVETIKSLLADL